MKTQNPQIPSSNPTPSILVIEDQPEILMLMALLLRRNGFDVLTADTGAHGLELLETHRCDLVISDFDLPDFNGFEVCRRIKLAPRLDDIPIILMSGRLTEGDAAMLKLGIVAFLAKPFHADKLLAHVSAAIHNAPKSC